MMTLSKIERDFFKKLGAHREELERRAYEYESNNNLDELFLMKTKLGKLSGMIDMFQMAKHEIKSYVKSEIDKDSRLYLNLFCEYYLIRIEMLIKSLKEESKSHRLNSEDKDYAKREAEIQTLKLISLKFKKVFEEVVEERELLFTNFTF